MPRVKITMRRTHSNNHRNYYASDEDVGYSDPSEDPLQNAETSDTFIYPAVKSEPPSSPSPTALIINAPSPDSTSPASVQGGNSPHNGSSEYDSDHSLKRPKTTANAGPSPKRARTSIRTEDDNSSVPSSANELKLLENRCRNNEASRKSRMNKRSKDEENEMLLASLEEKNRSLKAHATSLENIRNQMRATALARIRSK